MKIVAITLFVVAGAVAVWAVWVSLNRSPRTVEMVRISVLTKIQ